MSPENFSLLIRDRGALSRRGGAGFHKKWKKGLLVFASLSVSSERRQPLLAAPAPRARPRLPGHGAGRRARRPRGAEEHRPAQAGPPGERNRDETAMNFDNAT